MYKAKFLGITITLTWQELRSLKARFNIKNFKPSYVGSKEMSNKGHCILCNEYRTPGNNCLACPLEVFKDTSTVSCYAMIKRMLDRRNMGFTCNSSYVAYNTERGRKNIEKISVFLERFKKV